ncbi:MAG TPA: hypothetical protein VNK70_00060 [Candidatus Paceibacterota bacterium]|nr:hypothetical protein [Candidatus Paceibacterota bacterium]
MVRKFLITVVLVLTLVGIFYFVFNRPQELGAKINPFWDLFSRSGEGKIRTSMSLGLKKLINYGAESMKGEIQEKGSSIFGSLKEKTAEVIDDVQEKTGLEKSDIKEAHLVSGGSIAVLPVAKAGMKSYFLLSNPEPSREVKYEISWGDGVAEDGVLTGETKTISHSWGEEGEFLVTFRIIDSDVLGESIKVFVTK